jgi:hypothetical protein
VILIDGCKLKFIGFLPGSNLYNHNRIWTLSKYHVQINHVFFFVSLFNPRNLLWNTASASFTIHLKRGVFTHSLSWIDGSIGKKRFGKQFCKLSNCAESSFFFSSGLMKKTRAEGVDRGFFPANLSLDSQENERYLELLFLIKFAYWSPIRTPYVLIYKKQLLYVASVHTMKPTTPTSTCRV